MRCSIFLLICTLAACDRVDFENAQPGEMSGAALVMWVGSGERSRLGNGRFLYVPVDTSPLAFTRPDQPDPDAAITIQPEAFYTDLHRRWIDPARGAGLPRICRLGLRPGLHHP